MSSPLNKEALRDAKVIADLRAQRIKWRYAAVSKKIAAYSEGVGQSPTPEEFQTWIEDGKELERMRQIELAARSTHLEAVRLPMRALDGGAGGVDEASPSIDNGKEQTQPPENDDKAAGGAAHVSIFTIKSK